MARSSLAAAKAARVASVVNAAMPAIGRTAPLRARRSIASSAGGGRLGPTELAPFAALVARLAVMQPAECHTLELLRLDRAAMTL